MANGRKETGCFRLRYPGREIPQNFRRFLSATGRNKLTSFGQYCALWQEFPSISGISPLRIKQSKTAGLLPSICHFCVRRCLFVPFLPLLLTRRSCFRLKIDFYAIDLPRSDSLCRWMRRTLLAMNWARVFLYLTLMTLILALIMIPILFGNTKNASKKCQ